METKFNFNSQVCTSRSQSERLLALGLKKETADMTWFRRSKNADWESSTISYKEWVEEILPIISGFTLEDIIPAWSLHRLLNLIPKELEVDVIPMCGRNYKQWVCFNMNYDYNIIYYDCNQEEFRGFYESNIYDKVISCIEWLIKEGYFKEYLV